MDREAYNNMKLWQNPDALPKVSSQQPSAISLPDGCMHIHRARGAPTVALTPCSSVLQGAGRQAVCAGQGRAGQGRVAAVLVSMASFSVKAFQ